MGTEVFSLLRAQQGQAAGSMFARPVSESIFSSLGTTSVVAIVAAIGVLVATYLVLSGLIQRRSSEDEQDGPEEALERLSKIERSVQRLTERVGGLEEKLRVEVVNLGRSVSSILASSGQPRDSAASEIKNVPSAQSSRSGQRETRTSQSRYDLARKAIPITSSSEIEPLERKLESSRRGLLSKIKSVFHGYPALDAETLEELEVLLVTSDLGLKTASSLVRDLKQAVREGASVSKEQIMAHIHGQMRKFLVKEGENFGREFRPVASVPHQPKVVFIVGVNGVGKTTTVAKLAHRWTTEGAQVVLAAADTFRAAADEQLREWGNRVGVKVISGAQNDKPSTVVHTALEAARAESVDVVLVDTAGRLHNRGSLMQELEGMVRTVKKLQPQSPEEVWLVIDGTTGQNALVQAREFQTTVPITGVIVTKLDGTAKGGVVVAVSEELGIPVRYIGVGETWDDLRPFDPDQFISALLGDGTLSGLE